MADARKMSGADKAALVVQALGPTVAGPILRQIPEGQLTRLLQAVATPHPANREDQGRVLYEFAQMLQIHANIAQGGLGYARRLLESAFGRAEAESWLGRIQSRGRPFSAMYNARPEDVVALLQAEHPQTIALVLSYLPSQLGARVLEQLQNDVRVDVARRIGRMEAVPPRVLKAVEESVVQRLATWAPEDARATKGIEAIVGMLNKVDRATERNTLKDLATIDPDLAEEIKAQMFLFEDIATLDDRVMQIVLRRIDKKDLALALRIVAPEAQARLFANMSHQAVEEVQVEMTETGPVPLKEVETAQSRIVALIREMEENEQLDLMRGGDANVMV